MLGVLLVWLSHAFAADPPVRLGVLAYRAKADTLARWQPTADYLAAATGRSFVVQALDYPELDLAIANRRLDFVLTNPGHYVRLGKQNGLSSPLATLIEIENGHPLTQFGGVIFARIERHDLRQLADLRGKRVAMPEIGSLGGYQMQAYELLQAGLRVEDDYQPLVTGMPHDKAVHAVLEGRADAGFVRTGVLDDLAGTGRIDLAKLKILNPRQPPGFPYVLSTRLYPEWAIAAASGSDAKLGQAITKALFSLSPDHPATRLGRYHGWAIPADYEPVRELLQALRLPPFDAEPEFSLADFVRRYWLGAALLATGLLIILGLLILLAARNRQLILKDRNLAESELRFRQFADNSNLVFWVRTRFDMLYISQAYEAIWGRTRDSLYAHPESFVEAVHPDDRDRIRAASERELALPGTFDEEYRVIRPNGGMSWVHARSFPVKDADGQVIRWTGVAEDITARKQAEAQLRAREEEHQQILSALGEGVYGVDIQGRCIFANPAALSILGFQADELLGQDQHALTHHHFPDGSDYDPARCPIYQTLRDGQPRRSEEWLFRKDGSIFPVDMSISPIERAGIRTGAVAAFHEIGERLSAQARDRLLVSALEAVASGVVITDPDARIEWVNPAFSLLTGYSREEAMGHRPAELVKSGIQDKPFYETMWKTILSGRTWRGEVINKRRDGSLYDEELMITPVLDENGSIRHFVGVKQDISERKHMEAELHALATTDPLTGLPNRRHFLARLEQETGRLQRFDQPPSALLMLDLDHFKQINDHHGHAAGDAMLRRFADLLRRDLRKTDLAGRLGGEEFAILLVGAGADSALEFAERLRETVAADHIELDGVEIGVTVSIGVTDLLAGDDTVDMPLARADNALYSAKSLGRNRVERG